MNTKQLRILWLDSILPFTLEPKLLAKMTLLLNFASVQLNCITWMGEVGNIFTATCTVINCGYFVSACNLLRVAVLSKTHRISYISNNGNSP